MVPRGGVERGGGGGSGAVVGRVGGRRSWPGSRLERSGGGRKVDAKERGREVARVVGLAGGARWVGFAGRSRFGRPQGGKSNFARPKILRRQGRILRGNFGPHFGALDHLFGRLRSRSGADPWNGSFLSSDWLDFICTNVLFSFSNRARVHPLANTDKR